MLGLGVMAMGCGGGGGTQQYRDAIAFPDVSATGSGGGGGTTGGAGSGAGLTPGSGGSSAGDASVPTTDGGFTIIDAAPPAPTNTLLVGGDGFLVGPGLSCSRPATPAAGAAAPDRWCGFFRPAVTTLSLYVFNLTKALAGTAITCAATDPNCLRLDADVSTEADATHGFYGQTLIYYDATGAYAWRPGWTAGRLLLAAIPTLKMHCEGGPADVTTAICYQDDVPQTGLNTYAGSIATQAGAVLPPVEPLGDSKTNLIGFSPDSLSVIYSTSAANVVPATLKMQTIGDDTSRKIIATGITDWKLSADGTRWYWLSALTQDSATGLTLGTLQTAPYPAGTSPVNLQGKAFSYGPVGVKSVVTFSTPTTAGADMKSIADVDNPTTTVTVLQAKTAFGALDVNGTNGTILYYDDLQSVTADVSLVNLRAIKLDGTGKCAVTVDPSAETGASITVAGTGVSWIEVLFDSTGAVSAINGQVSTLADCAPHLFSPDVGGYIDVGTGLLVQENYDSTLLIADLSYRLLTAAGAPSAAVMKIQTAADPGIEALQPDPAKVLFSINGRTSGNGIYASPLLTGAATADLAPVARRLAPAAGVAALRRQPLQPVPPLRPQGSSQNRLTSLSALSSPSGAATRFSPFARRPDAATTVRAFARFAVPPLLRR